MTIRRTTALSFAILFLSAAALKADDVSIGDVKRGKYNNEVVSVSGEVVPGPKVETLSLKGYYLKDRYLDVILVKTTDQLPELKSEYQVTGVAQPDAASKETFILEKQRVAIPQTPPAAPPPPPAPPSRNYRPLIAIGAVVLVLVGIAIWLMRRQRSTAAPTDGAEASPPPPAAIDDFKTVKVYKTTKVLPGTLVVLEGGRETDIIYLSDQSGRGEVEIGRDSPDASGGIRIKDRTNTVSRRQARLVYSANTGVFRVVNLATEQSNPTTVNGKAVAANESVALSDEDTLGMGSMELKFRKR
jgi:hypothetical protein